MKAVVFKGIGNISLEEVKEPSLQEPTDVIARITTSAICGTDLHMVRGTMSGMKKGTILGHEAVAIIEQVGKNIRKLKEGDRVIVPSTICCGKCQYCKRKIYAQCDKSNPNGPDAGTAFYGGPKTTGPFNGLQAEKARLAFADASLVKIPDDITDDQAILLSDIMPTACMAVEMADVEHEDTVAVFGCGPVGQLVIAYLNMLGVKKIFSIDRVPSRLAMAKSQGAHIINFEETDTVEELKSLTDNIGPLKVIDAVGVDAQNSHCCKYQFFKDLFNRNKYKQELKEIAPKTNPNNGNWHPGNAPSQALEWAVKAVAKAGTISIIGVYPETMRFFPIGQAMNKNLTIRAGNCNHLKYIPKLIKLIKDKKFDPIPFITQKLNFGNVIDAYKHFDNRDDNWIKVVLSL